MAVIIAVSVVLLSLFPELDLRFAELFFQASQNFLIADRSSLKPIRWLTMLFVSGAALILLINLMPRLRCAFGDRLPANRSIVFLLLALGLGPGLLVNGLLKPHWGRARPYHLTQFGGSKAFTPALLPADQCRRNCSFVSGDAAMGYFVLAFVFVTKQRRFAVGALAVGLGTAIGLIRIAQGAHFLSDILFAAILNFLVFWFLSLVFKFRLAGLRSQWLQRAAKQDILTAEQLARDQLEVNARP